LCSQSWRVSYELWNRQPQRKIRLLKAIFVIFFCNHLWQIKLNKVFICKLYEDIGDLIYICQHCKGHMWYQERIDKSHRNINPNFQLYCGNGKVQLPMLKDPLMSFNNFFFNLIVNKVEVINNILEHTTWCLHSNLLEQKLTTNITMDVDHQI